MLAKSNFSDKLPIENFFSKVWNRSCVIELYEGCEASQFGTNLSEHVQVPSGCVEDVSGCDVSGCVHAQSEHVQLTRV